MLSQVLTLPGVVPESGSLASNLHDDWPIIEKVLQQALDQLNGMRKEEGRAMAAGTAGPRDNIAQASGRHQAARAARGQHLSRSPA